jgi:deoxyribonuclease V
MTPSRAIALQRELAPLVRVEPLVQPVRLVAGIDCAFIGRGRQTTRALAAAVLCDADTLEVLATAEASVECTFPYVPGLLSFREAPAAIAAIGRLPRRPDLVMIDGQGLAHPRGLGIASHLGVWLDLPAIGVAKSRLCGEHGRLRRGRGASAPLMLRGRQVGVVLRTRTGVRPLYVSVGHRITLQECIDWTLRCAVRARLPEPTRRAHQAVTAMKKLTAGAADNPADDGSGGG